jgi:hypothetical protein
MFYYSSRTLQHLHATVHACLSCVSMGSRCQGRIRRMMRCLEIAGIKLIQSHDSVVSCHVNNQTTPGLDRCKNNGCDGQLHGLRETGRGLRHCGLSIVYEGHPYVCCLRRSYRETDYVAFIPKGKVDMGIEGFEGAGLRLTSSGDHLTIG